MNMKITSLVLTLGLLMPAGGLFAQEATSATKNETEKHMCSEKCDEKCAEKCEHKSEAECKKAHHHKKGKKHCKHCQEKSEQ